MGKPSGTVWPTPFRKLLLVPFFIGKNKYILLNSLTMEVFVCVWIILKVAAFSEGHGPAETSLTSFRNEKPKPETKLFNTPSQKQTVYSKLTSGVSITKPRTQNKTKQNNSPLEDVLAHSGGHCGQVSCAPVAKCSW